MLVYLVEPGSATEQALQILNNWTSPGSADEFASRPPMNG